MLKPDVSHTRDESFCCYADVFNLSLFINKVLSQLNSCKPETAFICSLFHADLSESLWILCTSTCTSRLFWAAWTEIAEFFYSFCGLCTSVIRNSDGEITQMESKNMVSAGINSTRHGWQSQNTKTRSDVRGSAQHLNPGPKPRASARSCGTGITAAGPYARKRPGDGNTGLSDAALP